MAEHMSSKIVTCVSYHHFERSPSVFTRHLGVSTSPEAFAQQLTYFKRHYTPVSLDQLLQGDLPDNPLLLTIDDSYRSTLEIAAPMLTDAGIPALLMPNSRVIEGGYAPIDNVLSLAMSELGPTGLGIAVGLADPWTCGVRRIVREIMPALDVARREELKQRFLKLLNVREADLVERMDLFLDPAQLKRLVTEHGFSAGSHTATHMHLRALSRDAARAEIAEGKRRVEDMTGAKVRAFSFPYGSPLDATAANLDLVRNCGHEAIFLVQRRTNAIRAAADIWYRQGMSEQLGLQLPVKLTWLPRMGELKAALN